jgi:SAM-dependent methyltransferase
MPSIKQRVGAWLRERHVRGSPPKTYLISRFAFDLERLEGDDVAADISSNSFQHAELFESGVYYGVDIDKNALQQGIERAPEETKTEYLTGPVGRDTVNRHRNDGHRFEVAVEGDITERLFPEQSLDLVGSTHTLHHIPPEQHRQVVEHFCSYLRPGGTLLLQISDGAALTTEMEQLLRENFETVDITSYRNFISHRYIQFVERLRSEGAVLPTPTTRLAQFVYLLMSACSLALASTERIERFEGRSVYVRCFDKV